MLKKYSITQQNNPSGEALESITEFLSSEGLNLSAKENNHIALIAEESLNILLEHSKPGAVKLYLRRFLGTASIEFRVPGEAFTFSEDFAPVTVDTDDDEAKTALQNRLLRSYGEKLNFTHKNGYNAVKILVQKSPYAFLYQTLTAILLAVVLGVICRNYVPESVYSALNYGVLEPVRTMFMNALKIMIAPIVFFSLVNSVSQFGGLSDIGKTGGKFMLVYLVMEVIACAAAGLVFYGAVMFLGLLCGVSAGMIGEYSRPLMELFKSCNELFMNMTSLLTKFIPLAVLCSIWSMVLTAGAGLLLSLAGIICIVLLGLIVLLCIDSMRLRIAGLSVTKFIRKYSPAMAHVFSTTSSVASLPENMKAAESLGIPKKIYSFALPLGVIFSKNGSIFYRALTALFMAEVFGIDVSFGAAVSVLVSASIITLATPGVPGGAYIAFSALLAQMGVPAEALACIIGVDAVMDIFIAVINCYGVLVTSLTITKREGILDIARYNA